MVHSTRKTLMTFSRPMAEQLRAVMIHYAEYPNRSATSLVPALCFASMRVFTVKAEPTAAFNHLLF